MAIAPMRDIGGWPARLEHSDGTPTGDERRTPGSDTRSGNSGCSHTAREVSAHRAPTGLRAGVFRHPVGALLQALTGFFP
jgi:hypothetical protein